MKVYALFWWLCENQFDSLSHWLRRALHHNNLTKRVRWVLIQARMEGKKCFYLGIPPPFSFRTWNRDLQPRTINYTLTSESRVVFAWTPPHHPSEFVQMHSTFAQLRPGSKHRRGVSCLRGKMTIGHLLPRKRGSQLHSRSNGIGPTAPHVLLSGDKHSLPRQRWTYFCSRTGVVQIRRHPVRLPRRRGLIVYKGIHLLVWAFERASLILVHHAICRLKIEFTF